METNRAILFSILLWLLEPYPHSEADVEASPIVKDSGVFPIQTTLHDVAASVDSCCMLSPPCWWSDVFENSIVLPILVVLGEVHHSLFARAVLSHVNPFSSFKVPELKVVEGLSLHDLPDVLASSSEYAEVLFLEAAHRK